MPTDAQNIATARAALCGGATGYPSTVFDTLGRACDSLRSLCTERGLTIPPSDSSGASGPYWAVAKPSDDVAQQTASRWPKAGANHSARELALYAEKLAAYVRANLPVTTPPPVPTNLTGTPNNSAGTVSLDWADAATAAGYVVYRGGTQIATPTASAYVDSPPAGQTYSYTVAATNANGASAQTAAVTVTLGSPPPPGSTTMTATPLDAGKVRLDWTTTRTDITGWTVARDGQDTGGTGPWSTTLPAAARTYTMNDLIAGNTYTFTLTPATAAGALTPVTATATATGTTTPPPSGATAAANFGWGTPLAKSDEFGYTGAPDPMKWGVYGLGGSTGGTGSNCWPGHDNNGRRCAYTATVQNGTLRQHGYANGDTAGMASTHGQRYGRWEVRARLVPVPGSTGHPYHAVLLTWPDSDQWPQGGEYDFFEVNVGDGRVTAFMHHPANTVIQDEYTSGPLDLSQWHNYGFEWTSTGLKGYIDGVQWFHDQVAGFNAPGPHHLCIQLDDFYGTTPMQEADFEIEWARIFAL